MRVIEVTRFGGPEVLALTEVPDPSPGPGEAVVEVAYANVLWIDTAIRAGRAGAWFPDRPPYRPGSGVAGTVATVGAGVDPAWVGRRVVTRTGPGAVTWTGPWCRSTTSSPCPRRCRCETPPPC